MRDQLYERLRYANKPLPPLPLEKGDAGEKRVEVEEEEGVGGSQGVDTYVRSGGGK